MPKPNFSLLATFVFLITLSLFLPGSVQQTSAQSAVYLYLDGTPNIYPAIQASKYQFPIAFPGTTFIPFSTSSDHGQTALMNDMVDMALTTKSCKSDNAFLPGGGVRPSPYNCSQIGETVIARGRITIIVNSSKSCMSSLTKQQLKDIWEGRITNWDQIGCPSAPLIPRAEDLGVDTRTLFHRMVNIIESCGASDHCEEQRIHETGWPRLASDSDMELAIHDNPNQIGYTSGSGGSLLSVKPPSSTFSRYMDTVNYNSLRNLGFERGGCNNDGTKVTNDDFLILDFGNPKPNNQVMLIPNGQIVSLSDVQYGVMGFINGYSDCVSSTGIGHLTLAVGLNNFDLTSPSNLTNEYGQAWGMMIENLRSYCRNNSHISINGAMDIEMGWSNFHGADGGVDQWLEGYSNKTSALLFDFGNCAGCPTKQDAEGFGRDWSIEKVYDVAYGRPASYPMPEIYNTKWYHSEQWHALSQYGQTQHRAVIQYWGAITQQDACIYNDLHQVNLCDSTERNSPSQGWQQLYLNMNDHLNPFPGAEYMRWVTDMSYDR